MRKNRLMRKKFFLSILQFIFALSLSAQIMVDGRTAYYDILTDSYLISVPVNYEVENIPDSINLHYTNLPILHLIGDFGDDYTEGTITISLPSSSTISYLIKAKYRGGATNQSARKKHNFHIKFLDENGNKYNVSLLGLRKDNSYLLDAGQIDLGRIRNHVANEIWRDMDNVPYYADMEENIKNYVDAEFVEIFINDEYYGLYSLTEAIDRKQMKLKKYDENTSEIHGMLFKTKDREYTLMYGPFTEPDNDSDVWGGFELKYPEIDEICPTDWSPIYDALKFVDESNDVEFRDSVANYFDIPLLIDFFIFNNLLATTDHDGKNIYWACYDIQQSKKLTLAIWDYDTSLGQTWNNIDVHTSLYGPEVGDLMTYADTKLLYRLVKNNIDGFVDDILSRYWQLRQTVFTEDSLTARYNNYFDMLRVSGTLDREVTRWSGGSDIIGLTLDFDYEQAYIDDYIRRRLVYLDEIFKTETGIQTIDSDIDFYSRQWYNIQGQKVDKSYKGIVIIGGRKILIK